MAYPDRDPITNQVIVKSKSKLVGNIDSNKLYLIDGQIDLGDDTINVPETGIQISGLGFDISSITSTGPIFSYNGAYAGDIQLQSLSLTSPSVFDVDNGGNGGAIEMNAVNFFGCASLGEATAYRQSLISGAGFLFCDDGLTMSGTWSGGMALIDSIIIGGMSGTLIKAGTALSIQGSFRSNLNALSLSNDGHVCDFSPSNIVDDAEFSIDGLRVNRDSIAFPNMPETNVKARFRNCVGTNNTYPGGSVNMTAPGDTTFSASDTLEKITSTGNAYNLAWFQANGANGIQYLSSQPIQVEIGGTLSFNGNNNDQIGVQIRKYVDSTSSYVDVGPEYQATLNGGLLGTRAENVSFRGSTEVNENDIIEIWIKNISDTSTISTLASGEFTVKER